MEPHKEQDTELWDKNSTLILLYMDKYNIYIYIYIYISLASSYITWSITLYS